MFQTNMEVVAIINTEPSELAVDTALNGDMAVTQNLGGESRPVKDEVVVGRNGEISIDTIDFVDRGVFLQGHAAVAELHELVKRIGGAVAGTGPLGEGGGTGKEKNG